MECSERGYEGTLDWLVEKIEIKETSTNMSDEYSRGEIHFSLTFDVALQTSLSKSLVTSSSGCQRNLKMIIPTKKWSLFMLIRVHGDEYGSHDYWDKESYLEDTRER